MPERELDLGSVRRWLTLLRRPDQLAEEGEAADLVRSYGRAPDPPSAMAFGHAAAEIITEAIERLRPREGASREANLLYQVLTTCFVEGTKVWQAANKLGMSERQMGRERARAIALLKAELEAGLPAAPVPPVHRIREAGEYHPEHIPAILGFLPRPGPMRAIRSALEDHALVHVHGAPGSGKSSLVAELAHELSPDRPVLWYRFRAGVNDSLAALLFELGEYLRSVGSPAVAEFLGSALPDPDPVMTTRLLIRELAPMDLLLVLDDLHIAEHDVSLVGLLDEAAQRLPHVRIIVISRHRSDESWPGVAYAVPLLTRSEIREFLGLLSVTATPQLADTLHRWTRGVPHLVKLAAAWLKGASPQEVERGTDSFTGLDEVQAFLLDSVTELMGAGDRVVLGAASVFRDRFNDQALSFVADRTMGEVRGTSARLVRAYVATRGRSGDVAFFHNSVRDFVYSRLDEATRRGFHDRAAAWYRRKDATKESTWHERRATSTEEPALG